MRIAVASDTHSNIYALDAVLKHMDTVGYDLSVHLGDSIGFGTRPSETLDTIIDKFNYICMGSHEKACVEGIEWSGLSNIAKESLFKTVATLNTGELEIITHLESKHHIKDTIFVHDENEVGRWNRIFAGKTHIPVIVNKALSTGRISFTNDSQGYGVFETALSEHSIVNVGSVGMPLDGDSRACYAIFDTDTNKVTLYRVPYDKSKIVNELYRKHLDHKLIDTFVHAR
ncbi:metallophosphoesterase family protein [Pseudobutyrivibrio sp.]